MLLWTAPEFGRLEDDEDANGAKHPGVVPIGASASARRRSVARTETANSAAVSSTESLQVGDFLS